MILMGFGGSGHRCFKGLAQSKKSAPEGCGISRQCFRPSGSSTSGSLQMAHTWSCWRAALMTCICLQGVSWQANSGALEQLGQQFQRAINTNFFQTRSLVIIEYPFAIKGETKNNEAEASRCSRMTPHVVVRNVTKRKRDEEELERHRDHLLRRWSLRKRAE